MYKSLNIGLIGKGMVGNAIYKALSLYNNMSFYDPKIQNSKFTDILNTDCVFVCVPTIPNENNECDITIVIDTFEKLQMHNYNGIICIKSTITPGTTNDLINRYNNTNICFCPEFLKERNAYNDFVNNNKICIIGTVSESAYNIISTIHKPFCQIFKKVIPIEAELTKYMQNVFNTYKILFANGFYEICKCNNVEYDSILSSLIERGELDNKYMLCNDNLRGPSGPCLVKDSLAFNEYVNKLNLKIKPSIFQTIVNDINLYPKTVINGTRDEIEYFGKYLHNNV
jgi:UDPglucose 6-dehydrogenase